MSTFFGYVAVLSALVAGLSAAYANGFSSTAADNVFVWSLMGTISGIIGFVIFGLAGY